MRKLMIAMLALAVVFGFAACDNSTANSGAASQLDVAYIEATAKGDVVYLEGEKADPADYTFTGYDAAGNVVIENMASSLFSSDVVLTKDMDKTGFTYAGVVSVPAITVPVTVYEIDKITVDATADDVVKTYYNIVAMDGDADLAGVTAVTDEKYGKFMTVSKAGLVVTATYNGTETKVLDEDAYDVALGYIDAASDDFVAIDLTGWKSATAAMTGYAAGDKVVVQVSTKDATPVAATFDAKYEKNLITSIYFDVDDEYVIYYAEDATPAAASIGAKAPIAVLANMVNGQTGAATTAASVKVALTADGTKTSAVTMSDLTQLKFTSVSGNSIKLWASYEGTTDVVSGFTTDAVSSRDIEVVENVPAGITITVGTFKYALDTDYSADTEEVTEADVSASGAGLKVVYKLTDGTDSTKELIFNGKTDGYNITPEEVSSDNRMPGAPIDITITPIDHPEWAKTVTVATKAGN